MPHFGLRRKGLEKKSAATACCPLGTKNPPVSGEHVCEISMPIPLCLEGGTRLSDEGG
jgi:hypothetical protein